MEMQQLLNKIICKDQKALLVISFFIFIICSAFFSTYKENDDYTLVNLILEKKKYEVSKDTLYLDESNNNDFVIETFGKLKKFTLIGNDIKLDSLKQSMGLSKNELNDLFSINEYDNILKQSSKSNWDLNKINLDNIKYFKKIKGLQSKNYIFVSKPIYSINGNYALVHIENKWGAIMIFKKENDKWKEFKLINPMLH